MYVHLCEGQDVCVAVQNIVHICVLLVVVFVIKVPYSSSSTIHTSFVPPVARDIPWGQEQCKQHRGHNCSGFGLVFLLLLLLSYIHNSCVSRTMLPVP